MVFRYPSSWRTDRWGLGPKMVFCRDDDAQAEAVCDRILEACEDGTRLRDQVVLSPGANHHSAFLDSVWPNDQSLFVKYGGLRFVEAADVKDLDVRVPAGRQPVR